MISKTKKGLKIDLSIGSFFIQVQLSKSFTWCKGDDHYFLHVGTITDGKNTAVELVFLPVLIFVGVAK